jgi:hypothetical protein
MKRTLLFCLYVCLFAVTEGFAQNAVQTKEYCTVFMKVFYQNNSIVYDEKGLSKSPIVTMPDGKTYFTYDVKKRYSKEENGKFMNAGQLINSFAEFGWELHSSSILNYNAGDRSQASVIMDTNQYFQLLTFVRPYVAPTPQGN